MAFHTGAHPSGAHTGNVTPRHARAKGVPHVAKAAKKGKRKYRSDGKDQGGPRTRNRFRSRTLPGALRRGGR